MSRQRRFHLRVKHLVLFFLSLACVLALTAAAADGDPDATYGSAGKVITDFNGVNAAYATAPQSVGKMLVAGKIVDKS